MEKYVITEKVVIKYDGRLYRVYKDGELVAYSDVFEIAKEYANHYVND